MASPLRLAVCLADGAGPSLEGDAEAAAVAAGAGWAEVRAEFEAAEAELSRFRAESDLTRLNQAAGSRQTVAVPRRLERSLVAADRAHRITDGRFDPRLLRDLDRLGYQGAPLGPEAGEARGMRVVDRSGPGRLSVAAPIDLGGIGKGLALRWAAARLDRLGVQRYLLEAGGDLVARGPGPDGGPWLVGIEDPAGGDGPAGRDRRLERRRGDLLGPHPHVDP